LFQVDQTFRLGFISGFVIKSILLSHSLWSLKEQRICVKFCFKVGKTAAETHMLCEAYDDDASSQTMTYEWFKRLRTGRNSTDDDELHGRP
jgi:hypothetical protein